MLGVGPFRWSLNKTGIGWSIGIPGIRYGISPTGQRHLSIGIPGTGLYWIKYFSATQASNNIPTLPQNLPPSSPYTIASQASLPQSSTKVPRTRSPFQWWKQKGLDK